jgi:hypothetical protein
MARRQVFQRRGIGAGSMQRESELKGGFSSSATSPIKGGLLRATPQTSQRRAVRTSSIKRETAGRVDLLFAATPPMEAEFAASTCPRSRCGATSAHCRAERSIRQGLPLWFCVEQSDYFLRPYLNRTRSAAGEGR